LRRSRKTTTKWSRFWSTGARRSGIVVPDDGYLPRCAARRKGWLLMLDEVQTGNGRTGRLSRVPSRYCPTSSRWRKVSPTDYRSARVWPAASRRRH
jgi:hypothetical protein